MTISVTSPRIVTLEQLAEAGKRPPGRSLASYVRAQRRGQHLYEYEARRFKHLTETEASLQQQLRTLAKQHGWLYYHTYDSRRSDPGFPDTTLVRGDRLMFVEVKSEVGDTTTEQYTWLAELMTAGAEVYIVRPSNFDAFIEELKGAPADDLYDS